MLGFGVEVLYFKSTICLITTLFGSLLMWYSKIYYVTKDMADKVIHLTSKD